IPEPMKNKNQTPAKSDAALRDIRKALEKHGSVHPFWLDARVQAKVEANVAKHHRAKFKSFVLTVAHLGDVDLEKIARRVRVSKELLDKWMNTPEVATLVNSFLDSGRNQRAKTFLFWAKVLSTPKAPHNADDEIRTDGIDYLPLAKHAALVFED